MLKKRYAALGWLLLLGPFKVPAAPVMWEAGRLDYVDGSSEVAAFVNAAANTQLQVVLCAKNEPQNYRVTLLLPKIIESSQIFEVKIECDGLNTSAFAELNGNALEFQLEGDVYLSLPDSPDFTITFNEEDALYLNLPQVISAPMIGASHVIRRVASECTVLCLRHDFSCRRPLVSSILWPVTGFTDDSAAAISSLCTLDSENGRVFNLSDSCKVALNRFYEREGEGPLSFIREVFLSEDSTFARYTQKWNEAVGHMASGPVVGNVYAGERDWYLLLYILAGGVRVNDMPAGFYEILNHPEDPTTVIYDIENRYEMEALKYTAVLIRRNQSSLNAVNSIEQALQLWQDFYRDFIYALPAAREAQALRPVIYRAMLLRIWRMAGMPRGLSYSPEYAFVQGTGGRTSTGELLELKCSYFEGVRRDEFFRASSSCLTGIEQGLRLHGLKTQGFEEVLDAWQDFEASWQESEFYKQDHEDVTGLGLKANFGLTLLTMYRIYGFGDYFLLRSCIQTRDGDVCSFESRKVLNNLNHEFNNKLAAIMAVSRQDGSELERLQHKWQLYQDALGRFLHDLVQNGVLPYWQSELVRGISAVVQTDNIISFPYREEISDLTLYDSEDDIEDFEANTEIIVAPHAQD